MHPLIPRTSSLSRAGPHFAIWLLTALLAGVVWLHTFSLIDEDRQRIIARTENDLVNLGRVSQEHAESTFASADQALRIVLAQYREHDGRIDLKAMNEQGLFDRRILLQISIIDAQGALQQSNLPYRPGLDHSDRQHFKVHLATERDELFISQPILGRSSGRWSIQLSRRMTARDGTFAGVTVASLDPAYFTRFYGDLELGKLGAAALLGLDGMVRARRQGSLESFEGNAASSPLISRVAQGEMSGTQTDRSPIDGIERIIHFRKLPSFPLIAVIGMATADVFANHETTRTNLLQQATVVSFLLVILAFITSLYVFAKQRHLVAQRRTLRQLQTLTSRVPGVVYQYLLRPDGGISLPFASDGLFELCGLRPDEVVHDASRLLDLIHPDDAKVLAATMETSARMLTPWEQEFRLCFADGTVRWLSGKGVPQRLRGGSVLWACFVHDATWQRRQNAELVAERTKLQATLDAIPDLLFELGLDGRYHACHAPRTELLAAPPETLIGKRVADVMPPDAAAVVMAALHEAHAHGRSAGKQFALALEQGSRRFELSVARKPALPDEDLRFIVLSRDVTESWRVQEALRESEEREHGRAEEMSKLLDAVPAAVWIAHNPQATEITGNRLSYEWLHAPEGENVSLSGPNAERLQGFEMFRNGKKMAPAEMPLQLAASGIEVRDYEFDFVYRDGTHRRVAGNAVPLLDQGGKLRGAISAFVDITARQEADTARQLAQAEAERANNAKSRVLAAASHDLRQPLSALSLYLTVLDNTVLPAHQPVLASMKDCIGNLSELLNDLLDLSMLDAQVVTPKFRSFPIADALAGLESIHAPKARLKGLRLRCVPSQLTAHTDPVLFRRIVGNLIANAIRYTEHGGVLVACRRRFGKTWVEVWDSGIGIAADKTEEIFEEFKQLDDGARTRGSGLGLAIVAKTAALLGLAIRVRSRPGRGSLFAVELPLGQAQAIASPASRRLGYRPLCIAVVDDNPTVRTALAQALQSTGHRVLAAATGAQLLAELDKLGGRQLDIVISDYRLADGETGFDVIAALRTTLRTDLPALLITGDTDQSVVRSMAERGIAVLHKPLDLEILQQQITSLTDQTG